MRLIGNEIGLLVESFLRPRVKDEDAAFFLQPKGQKVQYFFFGDEELLVSLLLRYFPNLFGVLEQVVADVCLYFRDILLEVVLVVADDGGVPAGEEVDDKGVHAACLEAFLLLPLVYGLQVLV